MGAGIAQVCAQAGYAVVVLETSEERLTDGRRRLDAFLAEGVRRGKTSDETRAAVLERIRGVTTPAELAGCGWVIEVVVEDLAVKRGLLPEVADAVGEAAIIATNTPALSVSERATAVPRPERFAGLHFFNPAPLMRLVEVVRALQTAEATVQALLDFAARLGKEPVETKDRPGFLV